MVAFDDSWRSRRNACSWTRDIWRLEDSDEPGKQPFDHVEPFYITRTFSLFHRVHDGSWMATLLGLPLLHTRWYLHCSWLYPCLELCWWIVEICYSTWLRKKVSGLCMERNKCVLTYLQTTPVGATDAPGRWWWTRSLLGGEVVYRGLIKVLFTETD